MASINVCLSGRGPALTAHFHPEIELDERYNYSCCLLDFDIQISKLEAHIDVHNNEFLIFYPPSQNNTIRMPKGTFGIGRIASAIEFYLPEHVWVGFGFDKHSMKYHIETAVENRIGFSDPSSIGQIFGFAQKDLEGAKIHYADYAVGTPDIGTVRIYCDLMANRSFHNSVGTSILHEFQLKPLSNHRTIEQPQQLIYSPIGKRRINNINILVTDQNGEPIVIPHARYRCRINIKRD